MLLIRKTMTKMATHFDIHIYQSKSQYRPLIYHHRDLKALDVCNIFRVHWNFFLLLYQYTLTLHVLHMTCEE